MKHEKKWYTCDRCGEEIKEDIDAWEHKISTIKKPILNSEYLSIIESNPYGYISEAVHMLPKVMSITIVREYQKKLTKIHLCGKCRKEFEKFMRNEM